MKKRNTQYRPMLHWPYARTTHRSFVDDLWFWGFTNVRPFRRIFSDPDTGMLNVEYKNRLTEIRRGHRGGKRWLMFKPERRWFKSYGRTPNNIEMIRYRSRLNRN